MVRLLQASILQLGVPESICYARGMKSTNTSTPMLVGALAIASIIGATAFVLTQSNTGKQTIASPALHHKRSLRKPPRKQTKQSSVGTDTTGSTAATNTASSGYKDGSYSASAVYSVPRIQQRYHRDGLGRKRRYSIGKQQTFLRRPRIWRLRRLV